MLHEPRRPTRRVSGFTAAPAATVAATLLGLLILTFCIGRLMPSDPVRSIIGEDADQATYEAVTRRLGLDQPIYVQFSRYLRGSRERRFRRHASAPAGR